MNDFSGGSRSSGLIAGLKSEDIMEKLQALSTLLESLTFDSTAVFEYARPVIFLPLLIPLVKLDQEGGGWELGGEIAFQATRCLGLYLESSPELSSEMILRFGGTRLLVKWLLSLEQIEFAELAVTTLASVVKEQHLSLVSDGSEKHFISDNGDVMKNDDEEEEGINGILAIINILDFLPIDVQRTAVVTVIKGCTHLSKKYWKYLKDAIPFVTSMIGTVNSDQVELGPHAEGALKITVAALRSVVGPQGGQRRVGEGVVEDVSSQGETVCETILDMSSHGVVDLSVTILQNSASYEDNIIVEVMEVVSLLIQGSQKVRQNLISTTPIIPAMCSFISTYSSQHSKRDLVSHGLVLIDSLLDNENESMISSSGQQAKVVELRGVRVFGGADGQGLLSRIEYGVKVPLLLSWFSDAGQCRHLVGVPTQAALLSPPVIEVNEKGNVEPVEVLGWVHGDVFAACLPVSLSASNSVPLIETDGQIISVICRCVRALGGVDPVPVVGLKLLRRFLEFLTPKDEELHDDQGVTAIVAAALNSGSNSAAMEAMKIIQMLLFNDAEEHADFTIRCHSLDRHGALFALSSLSKQPLEATSTTKSKLELFQASQVIQQAEALMGRINKVSTSISAPNPLHDCCNSLESSLKAEVSMSVSSESVEGQLIQYESLLQDFFGLIPNLTPYQWKSTSATAMLITFFTLSGHLEEPNTLSDVVALKQSRLALFLKVASSPLTHNASKCHLQNLLQLLHQCIASELLDSSNLPLVLSKPMGGDPAPLPPPTQAAEEAPRGRIAKRLAELGVISGGGGREKKENDGEEGTEARVWGGDSQFGASAAMEMLNQPLQVIAKMVWSNPTKRRGNRRGRSITHALPMVIEPTTSLGSLVEYAIASAGELGMGVSELDLPRGENSSIVNMIDLSIANVLVGQFHMIKRNEAEKHQLRSVDGQGGVCLLHAVHEAYRAISKNGAGSLSSKAYPEAPSSNIWSLPHTLEISVNCEPIPEVDVPDPGLNDQALELPIPSESWWDEGNTLNQMLQPRLIPKLSFEETEVIVGNSVIVELLILIRLLREVVAYYTTYTGILTLDSVRLDLLPSHEDWYNDAITHRFIKQLGDPLVLACGSASLPPWLGVIAKSISCCLPLEVRQRWLHSTSFGSSHALRALHRHNQSRLVDHRRGKDIPLPPTALKSIVLVNRQDEGGVLSAALRAFRIAKHRKEGNRTASEVLQDEGVDEWEKGVQLEASFEGEPGSGAGPTAEFFSLLSESFMKIHPVLWRGQSSGDEPLETIFPRSLATSTGEEVVGALPSYHNEMLGCLGWALMQSLQDGHLLDLPVALPLLSLLMWDEQKETSHPLLGCRSKALSQVQHLDPSLARHISSLLDIASSEEGEDDPIEALCLDWTLPGRPDVSLLYPSDKENEFEEIVTRKSLNRWLERVLEITLLGNSTNRQLIQSLRDGAMVVGDPRSLSCFSPSELESLLMGDSVVGTQGPLGSDMNLILESIETAHGYTHDSLAVKTLAECLASFDKKDQVAFIRFVTGSPRLPFGGLAVLRPPLTVVKKSASSSEGSLELPSASTCTNYLKLPDYGSLEVLRSRLLLAIHEGQGAFFLS